MPKPRLKPEYQRLKTELVQAMLDGHHNWRPDLDYPQSHSDMEACAIELIKRYEFHPKNVPFTLAEISE